MPNASPAKILTSLTNPHVKHIAALRRRAHRAPDGLTIVEGRREVILALEAGACFKEAYVCRSMLAGAPGSKKSAPGSTSKVDPVLKKLDLLNTPVYETSPAVFERISYGNRHEGVLCVCAPKALRLNDLKIGKNPVLVVVEGVEKPGNLGAILRICDGAGVDAVIVCDGKTDIYNPNVVRASLGTVFSVQVASGTNDEAITFIRSKGIRLCAASPQAQMVYSEADLDGALAIVLGSEDRGLTEFWVGRADLNVRIPMRGAADSLNVSASAAVLLYESARQRK